MTEQLLTEVYADHTRKLLCAQSEAAPEMFTGGYSAGDLPRGIQGQSPGRVLGNEVPQKPKQFADTVYRL